MKEVHILILEEIAQREAITGETFSMAPIFKMYKEADPRVFLNYARDYIWFDNYGKKEKKSAI